MLLDKIRARSFKFMYLYIYIPHIISIAFSHPTCSDIRVVQSSLDRALPFAALSSLANDQPEICTSKLCLDGGVALVFIIYIAAKR